MAWCCSSISVLRAYSYTRPKEIKAKSTQKDKLRTVLFASRPRAPKSKEEVTSPTSFRTLLPSSPREQKEQNVLNGKHVMGYWTSYDSHNMRLFFDKFAGDKHVDPLLPQSWYNVSYTEIVAAGGRGILEHFSTHIKAIEAAYPEVNFDFTVSYWNSPKNLQAVFESIKKRKQICTLWSITKADIMKIDKGPEMLAYYKNSVAACIVAAYSDFTIEGNKLVQKKRQEAGYWQDISNVRKFFDEFAKRRGMDPLLPQSWYCLGRREIVGAGGGGIRKQFSNSHRKAIVAAYPEVNLCEDKFNPTSLRAWARHHEHKRCLSNLHKPHDL